MLNIDQITQSKNQNILSMITCYDFSSATIIEKSNIDLILVGDSLGEIIYGFENTTFVSITHMVLHTTAVRKGAPSKHIVADMPYNTYNTAKFAIQNAKLLIKAGANSVKLEIPSNEVVTALKNENLPVMGHVGLTPQTIHDYKKQGKDDKSAKRILSEAKDLEKQGCFSVLLEAIPSTLAAEITNSLYIPTIGIASGKECNGQVLVLNDMLGFSPDNRVYVKKYADYYTSTLNAVNNYVKETKTPSN